VPIEAPVSSPVNPVFQNFLFVPFNFNMKVLLKFGMHFLIVVIISVHSHCVQFIENVLFQSCTRAMVDIAGTSPRQPGPTIRKYSAHTTGLPSSAR